MFPALNPRSTRTPTGADGQDFWQKLLSEIRAQMREAGAGMRPSSAPSGRHTQTPPGPVQYTLPRTSTLRPSGTPGSADAMSSRTRFPVSVPSGRTSNARMWSG